MEDVNPVNAEDSLIEGVSDSVLAVVVLCVAFLGGLVTLVFR